jgi:ATP-dependent DNA helicase RecG
MIYRLSDPISSVKGIGETLRTALAAVDIHTVLDLVLELPYRYEDRSKIVTISELNVGEPATIKAIVRRANIAYRGRRATVRAVIEDATGKLNCLWFNNRFVMNQLKSGNELYFAGKLSDRGMFVQPTVEKVSDDTIHTARLVPMYSQLSKSLKMGSLRRIIKGITNQLQPIKDPVATLLKEQYPNFIQALKILHFPENEADVPAARERLALEELLGLISHSQSIKERWKTQHNAVALQLENYDPDNFNNWLPKTIPFTLTGAQQQATREILSDLQNDTAMNRLLVGDVGSGKTVVAGLACHFVQANQRNGVLVAPTQILAQQHIESLSQLFPKLKIALLTTKESKKFKPDSQPALYVGTHAVLNHLETIQPALIVYDEQHRFGVKQRVAPKFTKGRPHILTMSATPIPRSLMLTLFSHLSLSLLDELPAGRLPTTTWLVAQQKKQDSLKWIGKTLAATNGQALIVCPFIEPSIQETMGNVAAATQLFQELEKYYALNFPELKLGLLHGKLKAADKQRVIDQLFKKEIDLLITTPVVEVGVDLPAANIMVVEAAERFGLASLHQLRGRVGRAGQESYCLLFTTARDKAANQRLLNFTKEQDGLKLAEQDLTHRGAGDLFGFRQHGLTDLRFSSWTNLALIQAAHLAHQKLEKQAWQPLIQFQTTTKTLTPAAN